MGVSGMLELIRLTLSAVQSQGELAFFLYAMLFAAVFGAARHLLLSVGYRS